MQTIATTAKRTRYVLSGQVVWQIVSNAFVLLKQHMDWFVFGLGGGLAKEVRVHTIPLSHWDRVDDTQQWDGPAMPSLVLGLEREIERGSKGSVGLEAGKAMMSLAVTTSATTAPGTSVYVHQYLCKFVNIRPV